LNSVKEIRGGAAEMFFKHRDEIILEKVNAGGPESEAYDFLPREDFIRSRLEFPTFHRNWVDGILTSCLKILDFAGSVRDDYATPILPSPAPPGPVHDPMLTFEHVSKNPAVLAKKPNLDIAAISIFFSTPGLLGEAAHATALGLIYPPPPPPDVVEGPKTTAFMAQIKTITAGAQYEKRNPKDFIPLIPSDEFPNLNYGDGELSLQSKQELLFTAVIDALEDLINQIKATPSALLFPISTGVNPALPKLPTGQQQPGPGLLPIFTATELILKKRLPNPEAAADDAITNIVNFEALKRWLIKPLYLTAIGIFFGSHAEGFTGLMGGVTPDAVAEFNSGFTDPKPENLDIEEKAEKDVIEEIGQDKNDSERNNVPQKRPQFIPTKYKDLGTGFKNEFYQKLKELGSKFTSPGIVNNNADDAHRGLIFLLVFNHETGVDPGVSNIGKDKNGKWSLASGPTNSLSDAMIWGASIGNVAGVFSTYTAKEFAASPVWNPGGSPAERGMDVMQQLEHYQEFLARNMATMGGPLPSPIELKISGGKVTVTNGAYGGPDPHVTNHLQESLNKYIVNNIGTKKLEFCPPLAWYPPSMPGNTGASKRVQPFKEYSPPFYYIQNPYDLYAFHVGIHVSGDALVNSAVDKEAAAKHVTLYTISQRAASLVQIGEHLPRYMQANNMQSIDWDQVGVVGLKRYVDNQGKWIHTTTAFPDPVPWSNENNDEIKRMRDLILARATLNK
jgi:hypothetical protein